MFGSTLCQLMEQIRPLTGNHLTFVLFLFIYIQADTMRICRKYRLIPQKYNKNDNNMEYGGGYLWIWCGFVVYVG